MPATSLLMSRYLKDGPALCGIFCDVNDWNIVKDKLKAEARRQAVLENKLIRVARGGRLTHTIFECGSWRNRSGEPTEGRTQCFFKQDVRILGAYQKGKLGSILEILQQANCTWLEGYSVLDETSIDGFYVAMLCAPRCVHTNCSSTPLPNARKTSMNSQSLFSLAATAAKGDKAHALSVGRIKAVADSTLNSNGISYGIFQRATKKHSSRKTPQSNLGPQFTKSYAKNALSNDADTRMFISETAGEIKNCFYMPGHCVRLLQCIYNSNKSGPLLLGFEFRHHHSSSQFVGSFNAFVLLPNHQAIEVATMPTTSNFIEEEALGYSMKIFETIQRSDNKIVVIAERRFSFLKELDYISYRLCAQDCIESISATVGNAATEIAIFENTVNAATKQEANLEYCKLQPQTIHILKGITDAHPNHTWLSTSDMFLRGMTKVPKAFDDTTKCNLLSLPLTSYLHQWCLQNARKLAKIRAETVNASGDAPLPKYKHLLAQNAKKKSICIQHTELDDSNFVVHTTFGDVNISLDMGKMTVQNIQCDCRGPQVYRVPCVHALYCLKILGKECFETPDVYTVAALDNAVQVGHIAIPMTIGLQEDPQVCTPLKLVGKLQDKRKSDMAVEPPTVKKLHR